MFFIHFFIFFIVFVMIKYSLKGKFVQYSLDSLSGLSDLFTELLENAISDYSEQTVIGVLSSLSRVDIFIIKMVL